MQRIAPVWWFLVERLAIVVGAVWAVLTGMFAFVNWAPDPNETLAAFGAARSGQDPRHAAELYREGVGRTGSAWDRYVDWLGGYLTFDWGWSQSLEEPVATVILDAALVTAAYVVPALVLSSIASVVLGYYSATRSRSRLETLVRLGGYAGAAVPAFLVAAVSLHYLQTEFAWTTALYDRHAPVYARRNVETLAVPTVILAVTLFGAQARYVRVYARKYAAEDFVTLARSKGLSEVGVARHVLRNATAPLLSITVTEVLAVFVLAVYVLEVIFTIPGIGQVGYEAIDARDVDLLLGAVFVPVAVGLVAAVVVDVLHVALDPRETFD